jgi:multicomponent Na+:H+ antiporter subunit D
MTRGTDNAVASGATDEDVVSDAAGNRIVFVPVAVLAAITVLVGLGAGPLFDLSIRAAEQLHDPSAYLRAVWGGNQ